MHCKFPRFTILCAMLLIALAACCCCGSPITPNLPSTLNFQSLNEISPPNTEADWSFESSKLDMAICSTHLAGLRARNSDVCLLKYMLLNYVITTDKEQLDALKACAKANDYDMESAFLHYYDDTTATINGETVTTPGYGGGTAKSLSEARIKNFIWMDYGWLYNPKSPLFRKFMGEFYRKQITTGDKPDGIFVDAVSPLRMYAPEPTAGGHIVEYDNKTKNEADAAYIVDIAASFTEVNAAMGSDGKFGDRVILPNISYIQEDMPIGLAADGILTEFWIQPVQPYFPFAYDLANELAAAGKILIFSQAAAGPQVTSASNYSSEMDRHQMFSLSNYWIARQGKSTYYQQKAPDGYPLLTSFWSKAREYDVGVPTDPLYSVWKTGTDSAGQDFTIYKRAYTKALMLCRPKIGWAYTDYATQTQLYDLDGAYRLLHYDGTLGPEIGKIGLAMGEAVTLIRTGEAPPPDTTPPIISAVKSSAVTSASATVTWLTDEPATGGVEYGPTTSYGSTAPCPKAGTSHTVILTELANEKTYHYRVSSMDAAGNRAFSADDTFTTGSSSGGWPSPTGYIKHWAALGPFNYTGGAGHNTDYIGETTMHPSVGETLAAKTWTDYACSTDQLDLGAVFKPSDYAVTYLNVYVQSPAARDCQLRIGVDDAAKAFLNGDLVCDDAGYHSSDPDSNICNVSLRAGWNQLLIKAQNFTVGWTLYARFTDSAGEIIPDLIYRVDYPTTTVTTGTPKLSVSIAVNKKTAKVGEQLVYTVTYTNAGDGAANSATVKADVDPHVKFVSATNGGVYDADANAVKWNVGTVPPGASPSVTYTVVVK